MLFFFSVTIRFYDYTICQHDKSLISCSIHSGSHFPPNHAKSCIPSGSICKEEEEEEVEEEGKELILKIIGDQNFSKDIS